MDNPNTTPSYPPGSLQEFFDNTPEKWTKGHYARDKDGLSVPVSHPTATCFCLMGGIRKITNNPDNDYGKNKIIADKINATVLKLFPERYHHDLHEFNDHPDTTFEDIKRVLKEANV